MVADLVEQGALDLDADDRLWVPQAPDVKFRPLLLSVSQGYFVNLLRVRKSRHPLTTPARGAGARVRTSRRVALPGT